MILNLIPLFLSLAAGQGPIKVEIKGGPGHWQFLRAGKPFYIKGVGGGDHLEDLRKAGGNSVRTWGAEDAAATLAAAEKQGLTVMVGLWLGHRDYFNYADPAQVKKQYETVRGNILQFRNHPALLMWGLGNEFEAGNDTPQTWEAIEDLCKLVHTLDPNHPAATVVAEISDEKIAHIKRYCPDLDVLGINSYGGLGTLPERLRAAGWTKPYVVTEFGPVGWWESPTTSWSAAIEPSSTQKALNYRRNYAHSIAAEKGWCLGSFAFLWGYKQEQTPTWFGMLLPDGDRVQAVDEMQAAWTGSYPAIRCPEIVDAVCPQQGKDVPPGGRIEATLKVQYGGSLPLRYTWTVRYEDRENKREAGSDTPLHVGSVRTTTAGHIELSAPEAPGMYRIYVEVDDGNGRAATINFPFRVK